MTQLSTYTTGLSRHSIDRALRAADLDPDALKPADLAPLEDFHTLGRLATAQLAQLAGVKPTERVLDAGTAIGGTARYLTTEFGCSVTGIDLTEEYCDTARWLNKSAGLSDRIKELNSDLLSGAWGMWKTRADGVSEAYIAIGIHDRPVRLEAVECVFRESGSFGDTVASG